MDTKPISPSDGLILTEDTTLLPGVYHLPQGLQIKANNITLDGNNALILGDQKQGQGVTIAGQHNITIKNLRIQNYYHGIHAINSQSLTIANCDISQTAEVEANTIFLNIWLPATQAYGSAIFLHQVKQTQIFNNNLQHQMNGVLTYACSKLDIHHNNANYNSGFGFHLYQTNDSRFEHNYADYCCRYQPRGEQRGHLGGDAAGFLIVHGSSGNRFQHNFARLGGDGFFLAGMTPQFELVACNDNLFEANDASYSPNNGFEAVFSANNIFRKNIALGCNYGFWLGFSQHNLLEDNQIAYNRQAGIATENGFGFKIKGNHFYQNRYGLLLWSKYVKEFLPALPTNTTSYDWLITKNDFSANNTAIRIAANQDHGIRTIAEKHKLPKPYKHTIQQNKFQDNQIAIELANVLSTDTIENQMHNNLHDLIEK